MTQQRTFKGWRNDGVANAMSNLGTRFDRHKHTYVKPGVYLTYKQLDDLYEGARFVSAVIDRIPDDCTRKGWQARVAGKAAPKFDKALKRLGTRSKMNEAHKLARLLGGAGILMVVEDGRPLDMPIDRDNVRDVRALHVFDKSELQPVEWHYSLFHRKYGEPSMYRLTPALSGGSMLVHGDRILRFNGLGVRRRRTTRYMRWGQPVMERIWEAYNDLVMATSALATSVHQAQFLKMKLKNLKQLLLGKDVDNPDNSGFIQRMDTFQLGLSMLNALVLDADMEDVESVSVDLRSVVETYAVVQQNWSASTGIPLSVFFNQQPKGFANIDETGLENYRQTIASEQELYYYEPLTELIELIARSRKGPTQGVPVDDADVAFNALNEPTLSEQAEVRHKAAQTADIYIKNGTITQDEERARLAREEYVLDYAIAQAAENTNRELVAEVQREEQDEAMSLAAEARRTDSYRTDAYSGSDDAKLPDHIKKLSDSKRKQWVAVFNSVWAENKDKPMGEREGASFRAANSAVGQRNDGLITSGEYSGAMLAFYPSVEIEQLAEGLTARDLPGALHCTLVFMPDLTTEQLPAATMAIERVMARVDPLALYIQGEAYYDNPGSLVHVLKPSGVGLTALRTELFNELEAAGVEPSTAYDFDAHITLGYYKPGFIPPHFGAAAGIQWPDMTMNRVHLVSGDNVLRSFTLGGQPAQQAA